MAILGLVLLGAPVASAYKAPPTVQWQSALPGLPTQSNPQFHGVPGCPTPTMACIDTEIQRMDKLRRSLGCDHRAVFTTTYELLTIELRKEMLANPHLFKDPSWVIGEDAVFADMYFDTFAAFEHGQPVPGAWRVSFDTAAHGDANAVQDMLLGINAHVQHDQPYMMAAVGLHAPDGTSHKADHDRFNKVLNKAYASVVDTIAKRFDPYENFIAPSYNEGLGLGGNVSGDQLVQGWRELVWRHAEMLDGAEGPAGQRLAPVTIEQNSASTARMIAAYQQPPPGYRAQRDAYCAANNHGPLA